jgi:uncharacterized protein (DUF488 family)
MNDSTTGNPVIHSIGHGNRGVTEFLSQLTAAGVRCVVDVRAYPASKRHPQYTRMALETALRGAGIRYLWEGEALGGMRRPLDASLHTALNDPAFRGFADHMADNSFRQAVARILKLAADAPLALMCAEREPRHCHRAFIADALMLAGAEIRHLIDLNDVRRHALSEGARLLPDGGLVYDACVQLGLGLNEPAPGK